jgi:hypothetical protein
MSILLRLVVLVLGLSSLYSPVSALTNGTLLPAYICGPTALDNVALDGYPKSLGSTLTFFVLNTNPVNGTINADGIAVRIDRPLDNGVGGQLNNTQSLIGGFHNNAQTVNFGPPVAFKANNGITTLVLDANGNSVTTIQAGSLVNIALASSPGGVLNNDVAIDGAVLYALDSTGARVGTFTAFGTPATDANGNPINVLVNGVNITSTGINMKPWAACGVNNVGLVHTQLLQCVGTYTGIQWQAPFTLVPGTQVTFQGAAVTDMGFGGHATAFTVTSPVPVPPAPSITTVFSQGQNSAVFFVDPTKGAKANAATVFHVLFALATSPASPFASQVVAQSPAVFNLLSVLAANNITVTSAVVTSISITASNSAGTSNASVPINLTPLRLPVAANVAQAFLDLCPVVFQAQAAVNNQPGDPANQCAWQAQQAAAILSAAGGVFGPNTTTGATTVGNAASSTAAPTHLLFALIVAALLAVFRF